VLRRGRGPFQCEAQKNSSALAAASNRLPPIVVFALARDSARHPFFLCPFHRAAKPFRERARSSLGVILLATALPPAAPPFLPPRLPAWRKNSSAAAESFFLAIMRILLPLRRRRYALGGEAGCRLAAHLGILSSADTILRVISQAASSSCLLWIRG
jgi:hypothetical protein